MDDALVVNAALTATAAAAILFSIIIIAVPSHEAWLSTAITSAANASSWELDQLHVPCW